MPLSNIEHFEVPLFDFDVEDEKIPNIIQDIAKLLDPKKEKLALAHLYSQAYAFQTVGQYQSMLQLQMAFLVQLSKSLCSKEQIAVYFDDFIEQFSLLAHNELLEANNKRQLCDYLVTRAIEIGSFLAHASYQYALELYDLVIKKILRLGDASANLLTITKGNLLTYFSKDEAALTEYKSVFYNLFRLIIKSDYRSNRNTETLHLKEAIEKILTNEKETKKPIYRQLLAWLDHPASEIFEALAENVLATNDLNLFFCISNVLSFFFIYKAKLPTSLSSTLIEQLDNPAFYHFYKKIKEETSYFFAINKGSKEKVQRLISADVSLNVLGEGGTTPLQYSIKKNQFEITEILLQAGVNPNDAHTISSMTPELPPLYLAIASKSLSVVKSLLRHGANPNGNTHSLTSPLLHAISIGQEDIIQVLKDYEATLKVKEFEALLDTGHPLHSIFKRVLWNHYFPLSKQINTIKPHQNILFLLAGPSDRITKTPIFCPHALDGNPYAYKEFAGALHAIDPDRSIFGIWSPGLTQTATLDMPLPETIEAMADIYILAMREKQPAGPYILLGWSFGGLLVYEMARKLKKQKEEVFIIGIFDTLSPTMMNDMNEEQYAVHLEEVMTKLYKPYFGHEYVPKGQLLKELSKEQQIDEVLKQLLAYRIDITKQKLLNVIRSNLKATLKYCPPKEQDNKLFVTCFMAKATVEKYNMPDLGWKQYTCNSLVSRIFEDTHHFNILNRKDVNRYNAHFISQHPLVGIADAKKCDEYVRAQAQLLNFMRKKVESSRYYGFLRIKSPEATSVSDNRDRRISTIFFSKASLPGVDSIFPERSKLAEDEPTSLVVVSPFSSQP